MSADLFTAIEQHDLSRIAALLANGADPNEGHPQAQSWVGNATPLIVALLNQQPEAARVLLAAGADPNARDDEGDTPLGLCLKNGDSQTAQLLRHCGATER